jgi:hypothetical protein
MTAVFGLAMAALALAPVLATVAQAPRWRRSNCPPDAG